MIGRSRKNKIVRMRERIKIHKIGSITTAEIDRIIRIWSRIKSHKQKNKKIEEYNKNDKT